MVLSAYRPRSEAASKKGGPCRRAHGRTGMLRDRTGGEKLVISHTEEVYRETTSSFFTISVNSVPVLARASIRGVSDGHELYP